MNRIDEVAQTIRNVDREHDLMGGDIPDPKEDYARALDDDGHLLPDLPEPTYVTSHGVAVWKDGDDEVTLDEDESIGVTSRDRTTEQARSLAYRILAAVDYAKDHTNDK